MVSAKWRGRLWVGCNSASLLVASCGMFVAGLLTAIHVLGLSVPCGGGSFNCEEVLQDERSTLLGVPLAAIGLFAWIVLTFLAVRRILCRSYRTEFTIGYLLSGLGTILSVLLALDSYYRIGAYCLLCISSGILMAASLITYSLMAQSVSASTVKYNRYLRGGALLITILPFVGVAVAVGRLDYGYYSRIEERLKSVSFEELVPADSISWGNPDCDEAIILFMDFQCPSCSGELMKLVGQVRDDSDIRLVLRHYPLPSHAFAIPAACLAEHSGDKGKVVSFAKLCGNQRIRSDGDLQRIAVAADVLQQGENLPDVEQATILKVRRDLYFARRMDFSGTPTIIYASLSGDRRLLRPVDANKLLKRGGESNFHITTSKTRR